MKQIGRNLKAQVIFSKLGRKFKFLLTSIRKERQREEGRGDARRFDSFRRNLSGFSVSELRCEAPEGCRPLQRAQKRRDGMGSIAKGVRAHGVREYAVAWDSPGIGSFRVCDTVFLYSAHFTPAVVGDVTLTDSLARSQQVTRSVDRRTRRGREIEIERERTLGSGRAWITESTVSAAAAAAAAAASPRKGKGEKGVRGRKPSRNECRGRHQLLAQRGGELLRAVILRRVFHGETHCNRFAALRCETQLARA